MAQPLSENEKMLAAQIAALTQLVADLKAASGEKPKPPPRPTASGTYRLTQPHYREGRLYAAGELITIKDEVPGLTWTVYDPKAEAAAALPVIPPPSRGRASDQSPT